MLSYGPKPKMRGTLDPRRALMFDDNTTPRWAFLWSHGIFDVGHPSGWTFAHVWIESKCHYSYTNVGNLVLMPEHFASLTDKQSPLCSFFRFHAWTMYGWKPPTAQEPLRPTSYETVEWRYMSEYSDPRSAVNNKLRSLRNNRALILRELMIDV